MLASRNDIGLLLIRAAVGAIFVYHGSQKLLGIFGGPGIDGTAQMFAAIGIPLPYLNAWLASSAETFGGLMLIVGLLTRPAALLLTFVMAVAVSVVSGNGFDVRNGGIEYPLMLGIILLATAFLGAGRFSLDAVLMPRLRKVWLRKREQAVLQQPRAAQA